MGRTRGEYDMCRTDKEDDPKERAPLPVDHLAFPLAGYHVQQGLPEMVPDAAVADHLVPKDDEAQVVDVLHIVLLNVHSVLGTEGEGAYVSNTINSPTIKILTSHWTGKTLQS